MSPQVVFTTSNGSRAQKAPAALSMTPGKIRALRVGLIVLVFVGIGLYLGGISLGFVAFAPACAIYLMLIWHKWDLANINNGHPVSDKASAELTELVLSDMIQPVLRAKSSPELWQNLTGHWEAQFFLQRFGLPRNQLDPLFTKSQIDLQKLYTAAHSLSSTVHSDYITAGSLFVAMLELHPGAQEILNKVGLKNEDLVSGLSWQDSIRRRYLAPKRRSLFGGLARDWANGYTPVLDLYGENVSKQIESGFAMFSGVAREEVISQMIQVISRPNRNSVALVAPAGSGKSSLVSALAETMLKGESDSQALAYLQVVKLDANRITSQIREGQSVDNIIERIIYDAVHARNIILFLDETQLFMQQGAGSVDISHILMQVLEQTHMPMIFALSQEDWHKFAATRPALLAQVTKIELAELDEPKVVRILQDFVAPLESQAGVVIGYGALKEVYTMAQRYITNKAFPAKAIDLLQDALNYPDNGFVIRQSVKSAVEKSTGAKVVEASSVERDQLLHLEDLIHKRMINQSRAVTVVSEALRRSRAGVRDPRRPVGSFLFLGPTGVGKTELAKSLAATYFSSESDFIRLDMSEYQLATDVSRILEAATDDSAGSSFLGQVAAQPFSVILLDEIEKAHPDILNLLLQMLDEGTLTDTSGKVTSFKEAIIIVTSNAGADEIRDKIAAGMQLERFEKEFIDQLIAKNVFKPELLNRFDDIALFRPLSPTELMQVVVLMVENLNKTLAQQNIKVELTKDALEFIVRVGYDPRLGARPMRRALQKYVENTISNRILAGQTSPGSTIKLAASDLQATAPAE